MAFQPFGYRFEVRSPHPVPELRDAIRARKKGWFDAKAGARGWIVGPFICLWFSAFDRFGPMLFGIMSADGEGTRIQGRAGSDLNGVIMFSILAALNLYLITQLLLDGASAYRAIVALAAITFIGGPIVYWVAHKSRREAEPLVRFLRDVAAVSPKASGATSANIVIPQTFKLETDTGTHSGLVTPEVIHDALLNLGPGGFAILVSGDETYLQTGFQDDGYVIEKREGSSNWHYRAKRLPTASDPRDCSVSAFTFEEAWEVFLSYASDASMPRYIGWDKINPDARP